MRLPVLAALLTYTTAAAQSAPPTLDGQAAPVAPEVMTRNAAGHVIVRALKLAAPLKVDGVLDDEIYAREKPFGGMVQVVPNYGQPMTERSDVWVMFDQQYMYVTCKCWDSAPPDQWIVNELRRDTPGLRNNDHFGVMFDTFYDRRSGFMFYTNPIGARADYNVVDEGNSNTDWNPVWTSKTGRFDGGWIVEMQIPLKSIRFRAGTNQTWGIQLRRSIRRKNEWGYLTPVPQILAGPQALNRVSAAGTLIGLDLPEAGLNLELKPYGVSRLTTDKVQTPAVIDANSNDIGGDLRYAVTQNLTADLTINTDFAQVEIDEQQVNLTRFSLFFPEKRDFFLEGRGTFDFGRGGTGAGGGMGGGSGDTPTLYYTRRIGLNAGRVIPITAGGRVTGKLGPWALGLVNIRTGDETVSGTKATDFRVLRVKRDILKRSAIGVMATDRSISTSGTGSNQAYGVDGSFAFFQNLNLGGYWARTATTGVTGDDQSFQGRVDYSADRYGARAEMLRVDSSFSPQVGFTRRTNFTRSFTELRFSPRPKGIKSVRKFTWTGSGEYFESRAGLVEGRAFEGQFTTEFQTSDQFSLNTSRNYELLTAPFTPTGSPIAIAAGGYTFTDANASYTFGAQRRISGQVSVRAGEYYDGTIRSVTIGGGGGGLSTNRVSVNKHLSIEPAVSLTRIELPTASFTTRQYRARVDYGFTPLMFASALVQYSSADREVSTNLRFRWEYAPGSEFFIVYTEARDATPDQYTPLPAERGTKNRALVVKINRLLRL